jgi:phage recombination protein Bet
MGVCKSRGLNPFIKDCYLIKYSQKDSAAIVVSIDYYRKRAKAQADCEGWETGIIVEKGREIIYREGTILLDGEALIGGWFKATPKGWKVPMRKEVPVKRYIKKTREGKVTRFWSPDNQPEQIAKVAESQGLRAAWPDEFQGLYVDAERQSEVAQKDLDTSIADAPADVPADLEKKLGKPQSKTPESQDDKEPEPSGSGAPAWDRDNWINFRKPGFSTFVHQNLESFKTLDVKAQAEIIDKWHGLYSEPFPGQEGQEPPETKKDEPGANEPGSEPETEGPIDEESDERLKMIELIKEYPEDIQFKAKAILTMATAAGAQPPTLDGCNVLLEKMAELMKDQE